MLKTRTVADVAASIFTALLSTLLLLALAASVFAEIPKKIN